MCFGDGMSTFYLKKKWNKNEREKFEIMAQG